MIGSIGVHPPVGHASSRVQDFHSLYRQMTWPITQHLRHGSIRAPSSHSGDIIEDRICIYDLWCYHWLGIVGHGVGWNGDGFRGLSNHDDAASQLEIVPAFQETARSQNAIFVLN